MWKKAALSVFLSLLITLIIGIVRFEGINLAVQLHGIISLIIAAINYLLIYYALKLKNRRSICCMFPVSLILSFCCVTGQIFKVTNNVPLRNLGLYLLIIALSIPITCAMSLIITKLDEKIEIWDFSILTKYPGLRKKSIFILLVMAIILILWLPAFLAAYPGIFNYDALFQMWQILNVTSYSTHHPILHTLFLGGCLQLGKIVFGNYNAGMVIHSIVQAILMSAILSYACWWLKKVKAPNWLIAISVLFFGLNPYIQVLVLSTTKDVLFAGSFLLFILKSADIILFTEDFLSKKSNIVYWCLICILMMQLRNQGIYIVLLCAPFFIIVLRKNWTKVLPMFLTCIVVQVSITGIIFSILEIEKGDIREALSVPMQQIARTLNQESADLTEEERELVYKVIPEEYIDQYLGHIADPVKTGFNTSALKEDLSTYIKLYFHIGIKNMGIYFDAFYEMAYYNWYPDNYILYLCYDGSFVELSEELLGLERTTLFPAYDNYLRHVEGIATRIPVLAPLLSQAMPFWILLFVAGLVLYKKRYKIFLVCLLIFECWGTIILSPASSCRYSFPLMLLLPFLIGIVFYILDFKYKPQIISPQFSQIRCRK